MIVCSGPQASTSARSGAPPASAGLTAEVSPLVTALPLRRSAEVRGGQK